MHAPLKRNVRIVPKSIQQQGLRRPSTRHLFQSHCAWQQSDGPPKPREPSSNSKIHNVKDVSACDSQLPQWEKNGPAEAEERLNMLKENLKHLQDKFESITRELAFHSSPLSQKTPTSIAALQQEPKQPSIPGWFYQRNVQLREEMIAEKPDELYHCVLVVKDKKTDKKVAELPFAAPKRHIKDVFDALSFDHGVQLLSHEQSRLFESCKADINDGEGVIEEGFGEEEDVAAAGKDPRGQIHVAIYSEILATITASMAGARHRSPYNFAGGKTNVILHSPVDGAITYLDRLVRHIASRQGFDVIHLDPQDLAELGGNYIGEGSAPSLHSIRTLGYDSYRAELEDEQEEDTEMEDSSFESQVESLTSSRESNKPTLIGIKAIPFPGAFSNAVSQLMSAIGKPPTSSAALTSHMSVHQPFAPVPMPEFASPTENFKLTALLEALIDTNRAKSSHCETKIIPRSSEYAYASSTTSQENYQKREKIDLTPVFGELDLNVDISVNLDVEGASPQGPTAAEGPKKTVLLLRDFRELAMTQYGEAIITRLVQIVHKRRMRGEQIMIIGITSSSEFLPDLTEFAIKQLQHGQQDSLFRTIFAPPCFVQTLQESKDAETTIPPSEDTDIVEDHWQKAYRKRTRAINLRHLRDMVNQLGIPDSETILVDGTLRFPFTSPELALLEDRVLTHDEIHRIALTAIGIKDATLDDAKLQPLHILLSMSLLRYSDQVKTAWAHTECEFQEDTEEGFQTLEAVQHKTKQEADRWLEKIRETCSTHEKRLLPGVINPFNMKTTFANVHAPPETIDALKSLTSLSLIRPDAFKYGVLATAKIPGLLLYGPPGTGKTLLAKAVAKESGATVLEVSGSEVNDMFVGEGEKNVKAVFTLARKLSPCVVFIDEADAVFGARSGRGNRTSHREIINQFLREWDGMNEQSVFIMIATNRPFDLDDAVLRRLPRRLLVDLPAERDREAILNIHLRDENIESAVSLSGLASRTPFYSGSDLKNLCVAAALACVREENDFAAQARASGIESTFPNKRILRRHHFEKAMGEISASISEDMASLAAIRKFDEQYGDSGRRRKKRWGFGITALEEVREETARVRTS